MTLGLIAAQVRQDVASSPGRPGNDEFEAFCAYFDQEFCRTIRPLLSN